MAGAVDDLLENLALPDPLGSDDRRLMACLLPSLGDAARVAPVDKLSIVLVAIFAVVLLGEKLNFAHWIGISLITVGAMVLAIF